MAELPPKITDASVTLTFSFTYGSTVYTTGAYCGYCTIADVTYEFPNSATMAGLTHSVVAQEIMRAAISDIDAMLDHAYQMPYAGTDHRITLLLNAINTKLAAANIFDRFMQASEPNFSPAAARMRSEAELLLHDILSGAIQVAAPFGDMVARARGPLYDPSAVASVYPDPSASDSSSAPIFTLTSPGTRWNGGDSM